MKKGSVTIFSLLSMMLVASALFALLEASRFQEIRRLSQLQTQVALESVFAEYNTYLWEEYHLLACRQSDVFAGIVEGADNRIVEKGYGTNFFQFRVSDVTLEGYTRLTDGGGRAFIQAVSDYMQKNLSYEAAKNIYNQFEGIKSIQKNSDFNFGDIENALKKLKEEESSIGSAGSHQAGTVPEDEYPKNSSVRGNNLLEVVKSLQEKGLLYLVLEDTGQLSAKKINTETVVSNRQVIEEYHPNLREINWYDRVLLQQYLLTYMSNYTEEKEHSMRYELEYLLGGKASDVENMKVVVSQLLGVREAANFLYLVSNPEKVEQARVLAITIAGTSLNPVLIEVVKNAVLAAWAFVESVLDIRTLLTGGKIALLKSDAVWTMGLDKIETLEEGYARAKNCENGLTYTEYLGILLLFQQENLLAKRSMDMQELTLQERYGNTNINLEDWIVNVKVKVSYRYQPIFFSVHNVIPYWNYVVTIWEEFGY